MFRRSETSPATDPETPPAPRFARSLSITGFAALLLIGLLAVVVGQSTRRAPGVEAAEQALNEGRYDEVASLTAELPPDDQVGIVLRARADIARGRYKEAEAALRPAATAEPEGDAALELGLLLHKLENPDAERVLDRVASGISSARTAQDLARAGQALQALNLPRDAGDAFREAAAAAPGDPEIETAWGNLFLERHNNADALKSFQEATTNNPRFAPALLGFARALADDNPPQATTYARQALEINPNYVDAHVFIAAGAAFASADEAREALDRALEINPSSLEALALHAGLAYVDDDLPAFEKYVERALAIAPGYGEIYRVAADQTARAYRFPEAVTLARRGLELDPENPRTLADLGVHLLRTGDEPGARQVLERSFEIDPFDTVTFNLLQMMDQLDTFVTVESGPVILRMHPDEAPVLQERAVALANQALETISSRYGWTVEGPILVEVFPRHDDFAVRNFGLPGMIGALGACFGKVVTMDSPRARPPGEFMWEATLWHEIAHVVTLNLSSQRLPRWLSEGISEYEQTLHRQEWDRALDVTFASMLNQGETLKLEDLEAAFMDPRTINLAYFQASLVVEHLVDLYGLDGLQRFVRAFAKGLDADEALREALDTSYSELQVSFDAKVERDFGELRAVLEVPESDFQRMPLEELRVIAAAHPRSFPVQLAYGHALMRAGQVDEAFKTFELASELLPRATGEDSPHLQIAAISLDRQDRARAIEALEAVVAADYENVDAARQLATLLRDDGVTDPQRLAPVFERIVAIDPFDASAQTEVGRLALERGDAKMAVQAYKTALALAPVDRAAAHTDLAESYLRDGQRAEARRQTLAALEIAPGYQRAQDLLLELVGDRP
jgi:tetratricopeptide (TPR) repeat protein